MKNQKDNTISNFVLVKKTENHSVYEREGWCLSVKKYAEDFYAVIVFSKQTDTIKAIIYPDSRKVFYQVKGGTFGEENMELFVNDVIGCKESVKLTKIILKKDFNIIV